MKNQIDPETFKHLVDLAALELDPEEGEYLRGELNNQLNAIHELEAIPLEGESTVTSHGVEYTAQIRQTLREDEWKPLEDPLAIIAQAPESDYGFVIVPDIPHEKLD